MRAYRRLQKAANDRQGAPVTRAAGAFWLGRPPDLPAAAENRILRVGRWQGLESARNESGSLRLKLPLPRSLRRNPPARSMEGRAPIIMVLRRACSAISQLFELDRLVFSVFVDRRSPDLVRSLVFRAAKTELGSKTQVEIARVLQDVDELLGIELRSGTPKPLD
jgi:hypothetical protein